MKKKILCWGLILFFGSIIFFFSSQHGPVSSSVSSAVTQKVLEHIPTYHLFPEDVKPIVVNNANGLIRSLAHFGLFLCLGFSMALIIKCYPSIRHPYVLSMTLCMLYAVVDELHQEFFSVGRAFEVVDLLKDWAGSAIGITIIAFFYFIFWAMKKNIMSSFKKEAKH